MGDFVDAYSTTTGRKARIPAHWLEHKKLRAGWRKTPLSESRAADTKKTPDAGDDKKKEQ